VPAGGSFDPPFFFLGKYGQGITDLVDEGLEIVYDFGLGHIDKPV